MTDDLKCPVCGGTAYLPEGWRETVRSVVIVCDQARAPTREYIASVRDGLCAMLGEEPGE